MSTNPFRVSPSGEKFIPSMRNTPEVLKDFYRQDCTIVCIASGPSLTPEQIDIVGNAKNNRPEDLFVIGTNDNWRWKSNNGEFVCDYLYAADDSWWNCWLKEIIESGFDKPKFFPIGNKFAKDNGLIRIPCVHQKGLGSNGNVHCLSNSGAQAIGLSYYLGSKKIILIGYDMKPNQQGKVHWFGDHPKGKLRNTPHRYSSWIPHLKELSDDLKKREIDVVNCTIDSAIPESTFRKSSYLERELGVF